MPFVDSIKTSERHAGSAGQLMVHIYDYDTSDRVIYEGATSDIGGDTSLAIWYIYKYEYNGDNLTRTQLRENEVWDHRALLGWL